MIHLVLPPELAQQLVDLAAIAAPAECCGLIEGNWEGETAHATSLHPARNLAGTDRFEIAPQDHIAAQKAARTAGHVLIGCYHSHPGSTPKPSAADRAGAAEQAQNFLWLIAGAEPGGWNLAVFTAGPMDPAYLVMSSE